MPELGTEVKDSGDNVKLDVPYEIVNVEDVITEVRIYSGIRVELLSQEAEEGSIMLWKRGVVGPRSKLGAFLIMLGSNTDTWLHKWIVFRRWGENDRLIEMVIPPVEKVTKASTAKGISKAIKES